MKEWVYEDHWPQNFLEFRLNTIAGAMESGTDLYLLGRFGGFGGALLYVHSDLEKAKAHAKEEGLSVFKLSIEYVEPSPSVKETK